MGAGGGWGGMISVFSENTILILCEYWREVIVFSHWSLST